MLKVVCWLRMIDYRKRTGKGLCTRCRHERMKANKNSVNGEESIVDGIQNAGTGRVSVDR